MLKKKLTKDEFGKLPDTLKLFYQEAGDGYALKAEHDAIGYEPEDVSGLKSALDKERTAREALDKALKQFRDDSGNPVTAEAVRKAYEKLASAETERAQMETNVERIKTQLATNHKKELEAEQKKTAAVLSALQKRVVENECMKAIETHKGKAKVLLPHVRQFVKMVEKDGDYIAVVVDEKGTPRMADGNGTALTIDALVGELKNDPDYAPNFEASGASGGGAGGGTGADGGSGGKKGAGGAGGSTRKVSWNDQDALNDALEDLASGKAVAIQQ